MFHDGKASSTNVWSLRQKGEAKNTVNCLRIMSEIRSPEKICWIFLLRGKEVKWEIQLF